MFQMETIIGGIVSLWFAKWFDLNESNRLIHSSSYYSALSDENSWLKQRYCMLCNNINMQMSAIESVVLCHKTISYMLYQFSYPGLTLLPLAYSPALLGPQSPLHSFLSVAPPLPLWCWRLPFSAGHSTPATSSEPGPGGGLASCADDPVPNRSTYNWSVAVGNKNAFAWIRI